MRFFKSTLFSTSSTETWNTQILIYIFPIIIVEDRQNIEKWGSYLSQSYLMYKKETRLFLPLSFAGR